MFDFFCSLILLVSDGGVSFASQAAVSPAMNSGLTRRGFISTHMSLNVS